jgi:hypothetical protein
MKKPGLPHPESERHVSCPFCDTAVDRTSPERLCLGCGVEWAPDGAGVPVFDSSHQAGRAAVDAAAGRERTRNASAGGLSGDRRRRPQRLGKKG